MLALPLPINTSVFLCITFEITESDVSLLRTLLWVSPLIVAAPKFAPFWVPSLVYAHYDFNPRYPKPAPDAKSAPKPEASADVVGPTSGPVSASRPSEPKPEAPAEVGGSVLDYLPAPGFE